MVKNKAAFKTSSALSVGVLERGKHSHLSVKLTSACRLLKVAIQRRCMQYKEQDPRW